MKFDNIRQRFNYKTFLLIDLPACVKLKLPYSLRTTKRAGKRAINDIYNIYIDHTIRTFKDKKNAFSVVCLEKIIDMQNTTI